MTNLYRAFLILAAAMIVSFALLRLAHTSWADRLRAQSQQRSAEFVRRPPVSDDRRVVRSSIASTLQPFLKFAVYSGVPGCLTLAVLALTRRRPQLNRVL